MASNILENTVQEVHHWTESLFTIKTDRDPGFRFESGQFAMIGLQVDGRPLMRAYSIVSAHYEDYLEFFSIKVPNGPLTSRLQHVKPGDKILINKKTTGTLVMPNLLPGKRLYLLSTGTGLAPFLSLIKDPILYEQYDQIVLVHGVRKVADLAYADFIRDELPKNEFLGDDVKNKLVYYPTVTREPFVHQGRSTDLIKSGQLFQDIGAPALNPAVDRAMVCGSPQMMNELADYFDSLGFKQGSNAGAGHYVIEKAFAEK